MDKTMKTGIELIAAERREQIKKHGRTIKKDVLLNKKHQLAHAAAGLLHTPGELECMSVILQFGKLKDWDKSIIKKMVKKPYKERLIIAGALIAAEIDRLQNSK